MPACQGAVPLPELGHGVRTAQLGISTGLVSLIPLTQAAKMGSSKIANQLLRSEKARPPRQECKHYTQLIHCIYLCISGSSVGFDSRYLHTTSAKYLRLARRTGNLEQHHAGSRAVVGIHQGDGDPINDMGGVNR